MKSFIIYIFIFLFLFSGNIFAHNIIKGKIQDSTGEAIASATVRLDNTTIGAIANKDGEFQIKRIPAGIYTLRVTAVGYQVFVREIDLSHKEDYTEVVKITLLEGGVMSGDIVVSATRTDKLYEEVPIKISVIDNKIFESTQTASIQEGIRFSPGLRVEANCQNCGYSQIRLNGLEGRYSQILIDGRPIFTALNSMYGLDQIPANMIDRVEVIRGGGSALYGGNAIAGVVNIITKPPVENSFEGKYNYGFVGGKTPDYSYQLNGSSLSEDQDIGFYLFGNYNKRDTYDADGDGFSEIPTLTAASFGGRAFYNPNIKSKLTLDFQTMNEYRRGGDSVQLPPHEVMMAEDMTHNLTAGGITYESFFNNDISKYSVYASFNLTDKKNYTGVGKDPNGYGLTNSKVYVGGLQLNHTIKDFIVGEGIITSGLEYKNENVQNEATGYRTNLNQQVQLAGFYAQYDWIFNEHFNLVSGLRFDKHNMIDNVIINPRFTFMYKKTDDMTIRATASTGYRAPQAFDEDLHAELRSGRRMIIELADDLNEERSLSFNLGADKYHNFGNFPFSFSFEMFYNQLSNVFINEEQGIDERGNILLIKKNGDGSKVYGISGEMRTSYFEYYQLQVGVTYQKGEYDTPFVWSSADPENNIPEQSTDKILRTPDFYGYMTAYINPMEHLEFTLSAIYTGKMQVPHFAGGIAPDGSIVKENTLFEAPEFLELNASVSYIFYDKPEMTVTLGVNNITNQYQDNFDRGANRDTNFIYGPLKPRTVRMGISAKL